MQRRLVLYELNEVPWQIIDLYTRVKPSSALAHVLTRALSLTSICDDPAPLQPWRTWPSLHNSLFAAEHNSYDLGQDPESFRGEPIWDVAERAGRVTGIFGPLQSWPSKPFSNGGFYIPDTFARAPDTVPASLARFQAFNLKMTRDNTFSADGRLSAKELGLIGVDLLRLGLLPRSALDMALHIAREFREPRYKASRSVMQAIVSFDLFARLYRKRTVDLGIFFTNHVAGMMHRYWGDAVPGYISSNGYQPDAIFQGFVGMAMDIFDRHLSRMLSWAKADPDLMIVIASSMGQGAIDKEELDETFVVDSPAVLARALGLDVDIGNAMYPRLSFLLKDPDQAGAAVAPLSKVQLAGGRKLFEEIRVIGRTVSFAVDQTAWREVGTRRVEYADVTENVTTDVDAAQLGLTVRRRVGGGNTAYHVSEGIFIALGEGITRDAARREVSILDVAPSLLTAMGLAVPASYRGAPSILWGRAGVKRLDGRRVLDG